MEPEPDTRKTSRTNDIEGRPAKISRGTPIVRLLPESETKQYYPITIDKATLLEKLLSMKLDSPLEPAQKVAEGDRMLRAGWCDEKAVSLLWHEKSRMDAVFDGGNGRLYQKVRDEICPLDTKGSTTYWNRAGDKLQEVYNCVPFFKNAADTGSLKDEPVIFLDVCGGPGAWSQFLFQTLPRSRGYGITLKLLDTPRSDVWYEALLKDDRFTALYGKDGTGDVYNPENIEDVLRRMGGDHRAALVVADGGFKIGKDEAGHHMENYQELFSGRIILAEFLLALRALAPGGSFVCKLFDSFSDLTVSLVFAFAALFESVAIVKPPHSRRVNSERYLVASKLEDRPAHLEIVSHLLSRYHRDGFSSDSSPRWVLPLDWMRADASFSAAIRGMNGELCARQTEALHIVLDEVETRLKREAKYGKAEQQSTHDGREDRGRGHRGRGERRQSDTH